MRLASVLDLRPVATRVVIINAATDLVATRALLSARKLTDLPVLLINRGPTAESTGHFDALMTRYDFDIVDVEPGHHGVFLDELFAFSADHSLLLLDSDAELRDGGLASWMLRMIEVPDTFGAGYVEGPFWLDDDWAAPSRSMLYMPRPWVPFLLLEVAAVRRALRAGHHFGELLVPNEVAFVPKAAWALAFRFDPPYGTDVPGLRRLPPPVRAWLGRRRLDFLSRSCHPYFGLRPKMICYDTAARIYEYLRFEEGLIFAGLDVRLNKGSVDHYGGITRNMVYGATKLDRSEAEVAADARRCLREHYDLVWEPV